MKKKDLFDKVKAVLAENKELMQNMYDALDDEHKAKFDKDEKTRKIFDKHGIKHRSKE